MQKTASLRRFLVLFLVNCISIHCLWGYSKQRCDRRRRLLCLCSQSLLCRRKEDWLVGHRCHWWEQVHPTSICLWFEWVWSGRRRSLRCIQLLEAGWVWKIFRSCKGLSRRLERFFLWFFEEQRCHLFLAQALCGPLLDGLSQICKGRVMQCKYWASSLFVHLLITFTYGCLSVLKAIAPNIRNVAMR